MARRSLKPQLNQIRTWVHQGRTNAWIAHQLEVSVRDIDAFKREHELVPAEQLDDANDDPFSPRVEEEPDLRAEDDALVAAALDAEPEESADSDGDGGDGEDGDGDGDADDKPRRRRGRRGGRGRKSGARGARKPLEGTFDHGDEGYGLWLDPAVQDDPTYAEHWAGHRPVTVVVEQDQIVIRRVGDDDDGDGDGDSSGDEAAPESALDPDEFDA
ncbi:MAG: hypothetical protein QOH76_1831 [Thermoleophilaceae bacterium]|jgi:hypothetical protein|nr:hypothetical protein [Thermoleophilaceae bacterium]